MPRKRPPPAVMWAWITSRTRSPSRISAKPTIPAQTLVGSARAHRGDAVDELRFSDRAEFFGAARAIHRRALDDDGCPDAVAAADVAEKLREKVEVSGAVAQMMVRVDDREVRIDRGFLRAFRLLLGQYPRE